MKVLLIILSVSFFSVLFFNVSNAQEIALTFDDAPTSDSPLFTYAERSSRIRQHLSRHNATAAFFVITGSISEDNRHQLQTYTRNGHVLANHSHSHLSPARVPGRVYIADLIKADSILQKWERVQPWYRYPYLNEGGTVPLRDSIRSALAALGLMNGYVTVDNYDWYINGALIQATKKKQKVNYDELKKFYIDHVLNSIRFYDSLAIRTIGRSPRHVLLLHENDLAALFLGDLIDALKANSWRIISPGAAFDDPISQRVPDVLFNGQGRIGAIAFEEGIPPADLVQPSEDEAFLDREMIQRKIFTTIE